MRLVACCLDWDVDHNTARLGRVPRLTVGGVGATRLSELVCRTIATACLRDEG